MKSDTDCQGKILIVPQTYDHEDIASSKSWKPSILNAEPHASGWKTKAMLNDNIGGYTLKKQGKTKQVKFASTFTFWSSI